LHKTVVNRGGRVVINTEKLEAIRKALLVKMVAQVGILGSKAGTRKEGHITNAEVGLIHEKGVRSKNIPRRSFIEDTFSVRRMDLNKVRKAVWKSFTEGTKTLNQAYRELGIAGEALIKEAFDTAGFGRWAPLKRRKGTPLRDTGQLMRSISSRVAVK
jgi:hypothetical protein